MSDAPNPRTDAAAKAAYESARVGTMEWDWPDFPESVRETWRVTAIAALDAADAVERPVGVVVVDRSAPLLERVTQSLRALLPHAGVGFMAMGDNEHREYVKAQKDARAVLAEVDALREPQEAE